jgi:hypothetical protein
MWLYAKVPIPDHTPEGVLPPYTGSVEDDELRSPWRTSIAELVVRFGTSPVRTELLSGLMQLRASLYAIGIREGWQWIDGSFVERVEQIRGIPPRDIDVVTFADLSQLDRRDSAVRAALYRRVPGCDAYLINLANYTAKPAEVTRLVNYYYGMFSHQRRTQLWKGFLEIPLSSEDDQALDHLHPELRGHGHAAH